MWTLVPPKYLMGRINDTLDTYHRLDLKCSDKDCEARLKYDCGVYFVFSCVTSYIKIKTKIHYKPTTDNRKVAAEIQVLGKSETGWDLLNITYRQVQAKCNQEVVLSYILPKTDYTEFQICFPAQGRIDDEVWIETETVPTFKKLPLKAVLLGSSISQDNNSSSHMNICCYAYRKLGINIATLGISHHNTISCPEVLHRLLKLNNDIKLIVMDVLNTTLDSFTHFKELFAIKDIYYLIVTVNWSETSTEILDKNKDIDTITIDADGHYDRTHLNDYGTVLYFNALQNKNLL